MSGGIGDQAADEDRQLVVFTFAGRLKPEHVRAWNASIKQMRTLFGASLIGMSSLDLLSNTGSKLKSAKAKGKGKAVTQAATDLRRMFRS